MVFAEGSSLGSAQALATMEILASRVNESLEHLPSRLDEATALFRFFPVFGGSLCGGPRLRWLFLREAQRIYHVFFPEALRRVFLLAAANFTCKLLMPTFRELCHLQTSHSNFSIVTSPANFSCQLFGCYLIILKAQADFSGVTSLILKTQANFSFVPSLLDS